MKNTNTHTPAAQLDMRLFLFIKIFLISLVTALILLLISSFLIQKHYYAEIIINTDQKALSKESAYKAFHDSLNQLKSHIIKFFNPSWLDTRLFHDSSAIKIALKSKNEIKPEALLISAQEICGLIGTIHGQSLKLPDETIDKDTIFKNFFKEYPDYFKYLLFEKMIAAGKDKNLDTEKLFAEKDLYTFGKMHFSYSAASPVYQQIIARACSLEKERFFIINKEKDYNPFKIKSLAADAVTPAANIKKNLLLFFSIALFISIIIFLITDLNKIRQ
jgi:hypothetical protein